LGPALTVAFVASAAVAVCRRQAERRRHRSQTEQTWEQAQTKILIVGGGFGGSATALALDRKLRPDVDASVLMIDRGNAQLFVPLLWTVAEGRANAENVMVPLRSYQRGRNFHVLHADVQRIDLERGVVTTSAGERSYDQLVIALGSVTTVPEKIPGAREHALVFRSPADAMQLRNRIIDALEGAHQATDEAARRAWLTFVVIGGGDTGTELAATIYDFAQHAVEKEYPWLVDEAIRVVVIESADRLVPLSSKAVSERVRTSLERRGITVRTGVGVDRIDEQAVYAGDLSIPARTAYWAAGVAPPELVREIDADHAKNGALLVDEHLRVRGRSNVYAIGDNAWAVDCVDGQAVPALAQAAEHEAEYVAEAMVAELRRTPLKPFRFKKLGQMTLLGNYDAVAEIGPVTFTGPLAWLMWHAYYASRIGSWRTRTYLVTGWVLAALFGRETSEIPLNVTK
jgi:NADH:ubiquinone reductase (H+-translocating)